ncbi:MAG: hypothetical protein COW00_01645 [Bdellovibrio sp. CG12_big_fil_rev_8_21_14_0_65_39_13]|nr:MAG: hypothetical protein COW78_03395 [Bdellovibrio sp. CG22_combo_CG10-13_8_21_14_all_39_27]PIQ62413.1 MAG: hypothetical protein COW00_01645 [Bdellovibrio sp. CG12_big_fil_rev_8_21_14_0_65_39_13]PIR34080.1 MAG: hypothetical protein COV37_14125 [Bdellovibrio sp. CG11_big_fil_rev_8_21_14_0_20_39_38]PJB52974.1 MAG: hypothetical protein CO099_09720 [Bdellovibrio sp. CG_4_9_14_3_um_filter_39_7]
MSTAVIFQIQSTLIVALMTYGIYLRRNRAAHIKVMFTTIIWDILLVLQIELSRSAILKASHAMNNPMMLNIHVSIAILTVLFYFAMLRTGYLFKNGRNDIRPLHKKLGWITYTLRWLTYITSFLAVIPKETM